MNWPAIQAALSQPWVLALGVWLIAVAFVAAMLIEFVKLATQTVREIRRAHLRVQDRRRLGRAT